MFTDNFFSASLVFSCNGSITFVNNIYAFSHIRNINKIINIIIVIYHSNFFRTPQKVQSGEWEGGQRTQIMSPKQ